MKTINRKKTSPHNRPAGEASTKTQSKVVIPYFDAEVFMENMCDVVGPIFDYRDARANKRCKYCEALPLCNNEEAFWPLFEQYLHEDYGEYAFAKAISQMAIPESEKWALFIVVYRYIGPWLPYKFGFDIDVDTVLGIDLMRKFDERKAEALYYLTVGYNDDEKKLIPPEYLYEGSTDELLSELYDVVFSYLRVNRN